MFVCLLLYHNENTPMQYSEILKVLKNETFQQKKCTFLNHVNIFAKN